MGLAEIESICRRGPGWAYLWDPCPLGLPDSISISPLDFGRRGFFAAGLGFASLQEQLQAAEELWGLAAELPCLPSIDLKILEA